MQLGRPASILTLLFLGAGKPLPAPRQGRVWQADIQVRTLEITKTKTNMSARVVVYTEKNDDARDARVLILLPVGVGIERLGVGCAASDKRMIAGAHFFFAISNAGLFSAGTGRDVAHTGRSGPARVISTLWFTISSAWLSAAVPCTRFAAARWTRAIRALGRWNESESEPWGGP